MMSGDPTRLWQLRSDDWCVAGEAALLAGVAALGVRSVGVERAARALARAAGVNQVRRVSIDRVVRVAEAVTAKLGTRCLTRSLVLQSILARRGISSTVVLGAALERGRFRAHAWVEHDGQVLSVQGRDGCLAIHRIDRALAATPR